MEVYNACLDKAICDKNECYPVKKCLGDYQVDCRSCNDPDLHERTKYVINSSIANIVHYSTLIRGKMSACSEEDLIIGFDDFNCINFKVNLCKGPFFPHLPVENPY